ncbi:PhzF family phenazine biosynthesis protein [Streptomyces nitrosporeus]|uniref:PhzF family phenazine biosynthesis protein n=1 Tax=Streptomyces nitrosporeus TaxID=28894 RepID=UPI0019AD3497|nr:PhzF family phenazine biosynthesis protein [Streptomyces nitrosporeus]GGZ21504.1 phenazine biosynthesis protein PhzF [Streptomyces nitrosporeus]
MTIHHHTHPEAHPPLGYRHVDVFAGKAFTGNSLAVFPESPGLSSARMLAISQELRHFETIFLSGAKVPGEAGGAGEPGGPGEPGEVHARVFDLFEELPFAGHPVLGAAAVLHERAGDHEHAGDVGVRHWRFRLPHKTVPVTTRRTTAGYHAALDQGKPEFLGSVPEQDRPEIAAALSLPEGTLAGLPLEVVSTGLRYLIVPVVGGLSGARIVRGDFAELIARHGAQFAYLVDVEALEGRHWNNDGVLEDVATGSAAGCAGAYLARHRIVPAGKGFTLRQGRFTGRPSLLDVLPQGRPEDLRNVRVGGEVTMVARGILDTLPE